MGDFTVGGGVSGDPHALLRLRLCNGNSLDNRDLIEARSWRPCSPSSWDWKPVLTFKSLFEKTGTSLSDIGTSRLDEACALQPSPAAPDWASPGGVASASG
jgi:hypothetical protein